MEKVYIQLNLPNILTIGLIGFLLYTFGGAALSVVKTYLPGTP